MLRAKRLHSTLSLISTPPIHHTYLLTSSGDLLSISSYAGPAPSVSIKSLVAAGMVVAAQSPETWKGSTGSLGDRTFCINPVLGGKFLVCCISLPDADAGVVKRRLDQLTVHLEESLSTLKT
ncbi:hypothetical protein TrVE_jg2852 [Triparma verrucosa]|uniref:Uncharacterized protein n=2 Tax=Triparma TaxID=722752 RepID=A0A9W7BUK6_9STRA|nr:hypothetical protein TrVE_jg2852 [Triparma verrucosa]GMH97736.1 hypothetical protein TrST_g165 [Triparma strigata]